MSPRSGESGDVEAEQSASDAGLRYVTDDGPGIRRRRAGKGFTYIDERSGRRLADASHVAWIKRLAIPPAWTDVWICPDRRGHLQATGRDSRGRKVYRYHPRWRAVRDDAKYGRMLAFARALPRIRRRVRADLRRRGLPRAKVMATVVNLLERTQMRVGSDEYARENRSFGLTTLRDRHASVRGGTITFAYAGKSGREHEIELADQRLARIVARLQELPGQRLFQYVDDDGERRSVASDDVNEYLREISGADVTAKDFRTWAGTVLAAWALAEFREVDSEAQARRNVVRAVERVAERLGNTPAVSRSSYVHPAIIDAYLDGDVVRAAREETERRLRVPLRRLTVSEAAVMGLLLQRLREEERRSARTPRANQSGQAAPPRRRRARR